MDETTSRILQARSEWTPATNSWGEQIAEREENKNRKQQTKTWHCCPQRSDFQNRVLSSWRFCVVPCICKAVAFYSVQIWAYLTALDYIYYIALLCLGASYLSVCHWVLNVQEFFVLCCLLKFVLSFLDTFLDFCGFGLSQTHKGLNSSWSELVKAFKWDIKQLQELKTQGQVCIWENFNSEMTSENPSRCAVI